MIRRLLTLLRDLWDTPLSTVEARRKLLEKYDDDHMESRCSADIVVGSRRELRGSVSEQS